MATHLPDADRLRPDARRIARRLLFTLMVNTVVALFLALPGRDSLWVNWVYSQCIGLLIWLCIDGGRFVFHPRGQLVGWRMALLVMAGVVGGYSAGCLLANALLGRPVLLGLHGLTSVPHRHAAARRFFCLLTSRSLPPEQAKKQTDGSQTRANTRLMALNVQEGSREQRERKAAE